MCRAWARSMIVDRLRFQLLDRQPAQPVVAAERDDQDAHVAVERPVEPRETTGRRIAGHAGVDHLVLEPFVIETLLQQRWIRLVRRKAQTGGQAVAEDDDARS